MKNSTLARRSLVAGFLAPIVALATLLCAGWANASELECTYEQRDCYNQVLEQDGRPGEVVQVCTVVEVCAPAPEQQATAGRCKIIVINGDTVISCPTIVVTPAI